jgi:hypothetical protein
LNNGGRAPKDDPIQLEQYAVLQSSLETNANMGLNRLKAALKSHLRPKSAAGTYQQVGLDVNTEFRDRKKTEFTRSSEKTRNTADTDAERDEKLRKNLDASRKSEPNSDRTSASQGFSTEVGEIQ